MRPSWPEWVIGIALVIIGLTGVAAIWGGDIKRVVIDVARNPEPAEPEPTPEPQLPPGGVPAGPF